MKNALKELIKDTFTYGFASVLSQLIGFFLIPLYTSYLTPTDYGVIAMLAFIGVFFVPLASCGVTNAIFRRYNLHPDRGSQQKVLASGVSFVITTSVCLLVLGIVFTLPLAHFLVDDANYAKLVRIALVTGFFASISTVFTVVLRAQRRVMAIAVRRVLELLLTVSLTIYFLVGLGWGIEGVLWANLIGAIFGFVTLIFLCLKLLAPAFSFNELKAMLKYGMPFLPHRLLSLGSTFISQYFIKTFIGLAETGLFNIALKFALPLTFIVSSVQSAWVPLKFQIHREEKNPKKVFRQMISLYLLLVLSLTIVLALPGPEVLKLMTQENFHGAAKLLPFVLLIPFFKAFYFMGGTGFEFTNNTKPAPLISASGIIVLVILSLISIPYSGIYGIIVSMAAGWLTMALVVRYFATIRYHVPINTKLLLFIILNACTIATISYVLQGLDFFTRVVLQLLLMILNISLIINIFINDPDFREVKQYKYFPIKKIGNFLGKLKKQFQ